MDGKMLFDSIMRKTGIPAKNPILLFVLACFVAVVGALDFSASYKSFKRLLEILIFFGLLIVPASLSTFTGFYNVLML
jgi:hypothetical protein